MVAMPSRGDTAIEYLRRADGSVEPQEFHTPVVSLQHTKPHKPILHEEVAGSSGSEATIPNMEEMDKLEEVVDRLCQKLS